MPHRTAAGNRQAHLGCRRRSRESRARCLHRGPLSVTSQALALCTAGHCGPLPATGRAPAPPATAGHEPGGRRTCVAVRLLPPRAPSTAGPAWRPCRRNSSSPAAPVTSWARLGAPARPRYGPSTAAGVAGLVVQMSRKRSLRPDHQGTSVWVSNRPEAVRTGLRARFASATVTPSSVTSRMPGALV